MPGRALQRNAGAFRPAGCSVQTADALVREAATARATKHAKRRTKRTTVLAADIEPALAQVRSPDLWRVLVTLRGELLAAN